MKTIRTDEFWNLFPKYIDRIIDKFQSSIKFDKCWEWQSHKNIHGYAKLSFRGTEISASRLSSVLFLGLDPFDRKSFVCHYCDNKLCVNPDHIFIGSHKENMVHGVQNKRFPRGELNHLAVLTDKKVIFIRSNYVPRCKVNGARPLARRLGISYGAISAIISRRTWKHIVVDRAAEERLLAGKGK